MIKEEKFPFLFHLLIFINLKEPRILLQFYSTAYHQSFTAPIICSYLNHTAKRSICTFASLMNPKVEVTTQVMYNFKISSKHILLSKNYCPIIQYISQHVKCCLVKNHMKYRKRVWNPCNELIIAILEHLMHGIWITSATGHLSAALSQAHQHSTLHSSKFNSTKMRLTGTMQVERTASDAPLVHDAYP